MGNLSIKWWIFRAKFQYRRATKDCDSLTHQKMVLNMKNNCSTSWDVSSRGIKIRDFLGFAPTKRGVEIVFSPRKTSWRCGGM